MPNIAKLNETLDYITAHPEEHVQEKWTCNTGACFAGHAALLNGYRVARDNLGVVIDGRVMKGDESFFVDTVAQDILGIDSHTGDILFNSHNTRDSLAEMIEDIEAGEDITLIWDYYDESDRLVRSE